MALPMEPETAPMFDLGDLPTFTEAGELEKLAAVLLGRHDELKYLSAAFLGGDIRIHFLWDNTPFDPGKDEVTHATMGKAYKAPKVWAHLADVDFAIAIRRYFYDRFDERQRDAVLFHELLHIEFKEPGKFALRNHSIEEFTAVMRRYGAFLPDRASFVKAWANWESDQGGAPANLDAHRAEYATRVARPEPDQLGRAARDARRGKPPAKAEPDPDRLTCDGDNHVPGCEHLEPRS